MKRLLCFQIFHGEMTERSSCLSCQKQVQTNVPFWLLPLSLGEPESENSVVSSEKFSTSSFCLTYTSKTSLGCNQNFNNSDKNTADSRTCCFKNPCLSIRLDFIHYPVIRLASPNCLLVVKL